MSGGRRKKRIPNSLGQARRNAGKTQEQVAAFMQVSPKTVSAWETGRVELKAHHLVELSKFLCCTPNDILGYPVAKPKAKPKKVKTYEDTYMEIYGRLAPNVREAFNTLLEATTKKKRPR